MQISSKLITGLASTLLIGISGWLLTTTLEVQKDIVEVKLQNENIKETMNKVYEENCPYCVHAAHSSLSEHPILAPTMKRAHRHIGDQIILVNE